MPVCLLRPLGRTLQELQQMKNSGALSLSVIGLALPANVSGSSKRGLSVQVQLNIHMDFLSD